MQLARMICFMVRLVLFVFILCLLSSDLMAGSEPEWSTPINLSGWLPIASGPALRQNDNGTVAVLWLQGEGTPGPVTTVAFMARVKQSSGPWSSTENITGFIPTSPGFSFSQIKVAPDGTVWLAMVIGDGSGFVVKIYQRENGGTWQQFTLSDPTPEIRGMDFHMGPDGDIGLIWVGCDTNTDYTKGKCRTLVRRRAADSGHWMSKEELDSSSNGLAWPSLRVGPGGMMVAAWARFITTPNWVLQGKHCSSPTSLWQSGNVNISSLVEPFFANESWVSAPVMGADGTFIIAWFHKTGSDYIIKSATRMAGSSTWTLETRLSSKNPPVGMEAPRLAVGYDGTAVAVWTRGDSGTGKYAPFANVRDAGGIWASAGTQLTGWMNETGISDLTVLPDGRIFALWNGRFDVMLPNGESVFIAQRTKSGGWDTESVSGFRYGINHSALAGIFNDNALVVWVEEDSLLPPAMASSVHTGSCSFSPYSCSPSSVLADGYRIAALGHTSVNFSTIRPSGSVAWFGTQDTDDPVFTTQYGMFFSQWPRPFSWVPFIPAITGARR